MNCCAGLFAAYDGSCRLFRTQTIVVDAAESLNSPRTGSSTLSATEVTTIDPDTCVPSTTRSGSGSGSRDDPGSPCHFSDTSSVTVIAGTCSCGGVVDNFYDSQFFSTWNGQNTNCSMFSGSGCGAYREGAGLLGVAPCSSWDTTSATHAEYRRDVSSSFGTGHYYVTGDLSDEVTDPGACCIYDGMGGHTCAIHTECDCLNLEGIYQGCGTVCDPDPC